MANAAFSLVLLFALTLAPPLRAQDADALKSLADQVAGQGISQQDLDNAFKGATADGGDTSASVWGDWIKGNAGGMGFTNQSPDSADSPDALPEPFADVVVDFAPTPEAQAQAPGALSPGAPTPAAQAPAPEQEPTAQAPGSSSPAPGAPAPTPMAEAPGALSPAAQAPGAPSPAAQAPWAPLPVAQAPWASSPVAQAPGAPSPVAQAPGGAPSSAAQAPGAPTPAAEAPK